MCFYSKLFPYPIDKFKKGRIINIRYYIVREIILMKKRNLMLLSAIAAASILMTGCGFTADDPADSQAVTITPEPVAATATPAPTSTPTPTVTPAAALTTTPAPGTAGVLQLPRTQFPINSKTL